MAGMLPYPNLQFDLFDALGLDPNAGLFITSRDVRRAWRRVKRHLHPRLVARNHGFHPVTPTYRQARDAYHYLTAHNEPNQEREASRRLSRYWRAGSTAFRSTWNPMAAVGMPQVLQPMAGAATVETAGPAPQLPMGPVGPAYVPPAPTNRPALAPVTTPPPVPAPETINRPRPALGVNNSPVLAPKITSSPVPTPKITTPPVPAPETINPPRPAPGVTNSPVPPLKITSSPVPAPETINHPRPAPGVNNSPVLPLKITSSPLPVPETINRPRPAPGVNNSPVLPLKITSSPLPVLETINRPRPALGVNNSPVLPLKITSSPLPAPKITTSPLPAPETINRPRPALGVTNRPRPAPWVTNSPVFPPIRRPPVVAPTLGYSPLPASRVTNPPDSDSGPTNSSDSAPQGTNQPASSGGLTAYPYGWTYVPNTPDLPYHRPNSPPPAGVSQRVPRRRPARPPNPRLRRRRHVGGESQQALTYDDLRRVSTSGRIVVGDTRVGSRRFAVQGHVSRVGALSLCRVDWDVDGRPLRHAGGSSSVRFRCVRLAGPFRECRNDSNKLKEYVLREYWVSPRESQQSEI